MKIFKRFAGIIMILMMMMSMMLPAMAANITVKDAVDGETYTAYKIFDVVNSGDNYAYSIAGDSAWFDLVESYTFGGNKVFKLTASAADANIYVVEVNETEDESGNKVSLFEAETDAAAFAKYLESEGIPEDATAAATAEAENSTALLEGLDAGYYFVDTSLGSLCALHTSVETQDVYEKNNIPTLEKKIINETNGEVDVDDVSIGDTVNFQITVTDGKGTDSKIIVHDKMEAGLTLDTESFAVKVDGVDVDEANYKITTAGLTDDCTFEIVFSDEYVKELDDEAEIVITYSAVLNSNAEIFENTNDNTAWIDYSNQTEITPDTVEVKTYEFAVVKVDDDDNILEGAEFKLYDAATEGNEIKVVATGDNNYRIAVEGEEGVTIKATYATIAGLDAGTYYLEETVAPEGYNKLTTRIEVIISEDNIAKINFVEGSNELDADASDNNFVKVVNKSGAILPSTGGIGTTIFYCAGAILVVVALILIISKRRMSHES